MALLNRAPGEGPSYSEDGTLLGGIEGLQVLARTLQGGDGPDVPDSSRATVESQVGMPSEGSSMDITNTGSNEQSSDEKVNIPTLAETAIQEEHSSAHPDQTAPSRSRSREASRHAREVSLTGTGSSEDPDDEALLNEVSLSDVGSNPFAETKSGANVSDEASDAGATVVPDAANAEEVKEEKEAKEAKEAKEDDHQEDDDDDAASIASALSGLSLAQLTTPHPSGPPSPIDDSAEYVIGDMLKKKFLDCGIIPSVLVSVSKAG